MALYFKIEGSNIVFFGDTFNHRPSIKELGARFNGASKTWIVTDTPEMRDRAALIAQFNGAKTQKPKTSNLDEAIITKKNPPASDDIEPSLGLSVSQVVSLADRAISQAFPTPIWVIGEIQSLTKRAGGTIYFDFAEGKTGAHETATISVKCNIWQNTVQWLVKRHGQEKVDGTLADGNRLRALVQVKLYKDRGQISLSIEDIDPAFTQGALALARLELLKKLRRLGLHQKNKQLPIPAFPLKIALITAQGSRAKSDFEHQLMASGQFCGELVFIPCAMQGDHVPNNVLSAIDQAHATSADLIVLCRGGGSAADLRWFDGEEIAMAIANSQIPLIAAIGHHDDTCIAEEIAHTREKTPTAAADRILGIFADTRAHINEKAHSLAVILEREMTRFDRQQTSIKENLASALERRFADEARSLLLQSSNIQRTIENVLSREENRQITMAANLNLSAGLVLQKISEALHAKTQKLTQLDPKPWLMAGWTQLMTSGKKIISIDEAKVGDLLSARLVDGFLSLRLEEKFTRKKGVRDDKANL